jgi:GxxExxY protein
MLDKSPSVNRFDPNNLTGRIIRLAMNVHSYLGHGFLESIYQQALCVEFLKNNIPFEKEKRIEVYYHDALLGYFDADLIVDKQLIIETKAVKTLIHAHEVQLVNYLTATKIDEGLLLNFGTSSLEYKKKFRIPIKQT